MYRHLGRSLATVAIAGVLVFAVPISSANAGAEQLLEGPLLTLVGAAGGGEGLTLVAPYIADAVAPVCSTGVGCAVLAGTVAVGIGLYMTKDTWIPWVSNEWGDMRDTRSGVACGSVWCIDWVNAPVSGARSAGGLTTGFSVRVNALVSSDGYYAPNGDFRIQCVTAGGIQYDSATIHSGSDFNWPKLPAASGGSFTQSFAGCQNYGNMGDTWRQGSITGIEFSGANGTEGPSRDGLTWGAAAATSADSTAMKVQCVNPDGTTFEVIGPEMITGPGTPLPQGVTMPTCAGAAGAVQGTHGKCVTLMGRLGPTAALTDLSGNCAAIGAAEAAGKFLYPNCQGGGVACTYVIRVNGRPCVIGGAGCQNWPALAEANPEQYDCFYGEYAVPLGACSPLERAYEEANRPVAGVGGLPGTGGLQATDPNTDGDPRTHSAPVPAIDPPTSPRVNPQPAPNPQPDPVPGGANPTTPTSGADCWPSGYGVFNPASWVLMPVKCALKWAFVPEKSFMDNWSNGIQGKWRASPPGKWFAPLAAFPAVVIASGGCAGPALPTGFLGAKGFLPTELHPFSACSGVMATVAATSNLVLSAGIAFFGGMRVVQQLGYAFGFKVHAGSERSTFT